VDFQHILVLITVPSVEVGKEIADHLLAERLAACVNILPSVHSHYLWQGEQASDEEVLLLVKSRAELFQERLVPAVKALHPYEVPEIIALPLVMGSADYLGWIDEVTGER
jgi:periplasmic divalent cation tolerance protein